MLPRVKCPLVVALRVIPSGLFPRGPRGWGKPKARSVSRISPWKRKSCFPAEWACCSALPVCAEFRWESKRVFLLLGGVLTTINLGVWVINITFPPTHGSPTGRRSGHAGCTAELLVTLAGGRRESFAWSPNHLLWLRKNKLRTRRTI